jgi:hypothetical protein
MKFDELADAIRDRLVADPTLVAVATGGIKNFQGPLSGVTDPGTKPYLFMVYGVADQQQHAQRADVWQATIQVLIKAPMNGTGTAGNGGPALCQAIINRVYGDWNTQASFTPSYGLHRWQVGALVTPGWHAGVMVCNQCEYSGQDDDNWFIASMTFTCQVTLNA